MSLLALSSLLPFRNEVHADKKKWGWWGGNVRSVLNGEPLPTILLKILLYFTRNRHVRHGCTTRIHDDDDTVGLNWCDLDWKY